MNKAFEKILERLEEKENEAILKAPNTYDFNNPEYQKWMMKSFGFKESMKIVQEVAEEYKGGWIQLDQELPPQDTYILLSFCNFSIPVIGRYEEDEDGNGNFYAGDEDETLVSKDLYVNAWQPLPEPYEEHW